MYYNNISELPSELKKELSGDAQELYRRTFNDNYPKNHQHVNYDSEETAHEAAWHAVQRTFKKIDGKWR